MGNNNQKHTINELNKDYVYIYCENNNKQFIKCSEVNSISQLTGTDRTNIEKYKSWKKNKVDKKIVNNIRETNKLYANAHKTIHYVTEL